LSTNNHSPKPTSAFAQAKERLDDVVMETLISKDDPKDVAEKNAEAVAVHQPNSKPATASEHMAAKERIRKCTGTAAGF